MITAINDGEELLYRPLNPVVKKALEDREGSKNSVINRFPFLRVTCLQKLSLNESTKTDQTNNLVSYKDKIGCNKSVVEGFIFEMREDFDSSYSQKNQKIGTELKTLDSITIANPRRVPPPQLTGFTATNGADAGFFTTAKLQFTCHSLEQLEFLTPFLLHPGNTIFCEWGYSDKNTTMNMPLMSFDDLQNFLEDITVTVEDGEEETEDKEVGFFDELEQRIKQNNGNYEYVPGVVTNFDFSLNDNFGYDVSIDIVSISQTKIASPIDTGGVDKNEEQEDEDEDVEKLRKDKEIKLKTDVDDFEKEKWNYRNGKVDDKFSQNTYRSIDTIFNPDAINFGNYFDKVIKIPTKKGLKRYVRLGELFTIAGIKLDDKSAIRKINPYIKSFDESVILFREMFPSPKYLLINDEGDIQFNLTQFNLGFSPYYKSYDTIITDIKISNEVNFGDVIAEVGEGIKNFFKSYTNSAENTNKANFIKRVEFQAFKPKKFDVEFNGDVRGDIRNIYFDLEVFGSYYTKPNASQRDILTSVLNKISSATGGFYSDVVAEIYDTKEKKQKTRIINPTNRCINQDDKRKTYTFKFNQKESIVTNLNFDFALDGLFQDQVYANSISAGSNDESGKKFSLMLFENQENNIQLTDYRNEKVKEIVKSIETSKESKTKKQPNDPTFTSGSFVGQVYQDDPTKYLTVNLVKSSNLEQVFNFEDLQQGIEVGSLSVNAATGVYKGRLPDDKSEQIATFESGSNDIGGFLNLVGGETAELIDNKKDLYFDAIDSDEKKADKEEKPKPCSSKFTPIAETGISIQFPGLGGFQPLEFFKTKGITSVYDNRGEFVIYSVTHTLTRDNWTTELGARFRVKPSEDDGDSE